MSLPSSRILESLYGDVSTALGREFVTAGAFPALLVLGGWQVYSRGLEVVRQEVISRFTFGRETLGELAWDLFALLAVALLFFALRGLIFEFLQSLPIMYLREWRLGVRRGAYRKAKEELDRQEWMYTFLRWRRRDFTAPKDVPDSKRTRSVDEAIKNSKEARSALEEQAQGPHDHEMPRATCPALTVDEIEKITTGIGKLWALSWSHPNDPSVKDELLEWRKAVDKPSLRGVLDTMETIVEAAWVDAFIETSKFPSAERWIRPTALGTRAAALDDYAYIRYGIDTSTLWIRLWVVLDERDRKEVTTALAAVQSYANLTFAACALFLLVLARMSYTSAAALLQGRFEFHCRGLAFLLFFAMLAWAANHATVKSFAAVDEHLRRLIDLRRLHLFPAMGIQPPRTVAQELELFTELRRFFTQGIPRNADRPLIPPRKP